MNVCAQAVCVCARACACVCVCVCVCVCMCVCACPYLPGAEVHEVLKDLHAALDCGSSLEGRANGILHHHLKVLDTCSEAVVAVMPGGGLDVQDAVTNTAQRREVLVKRGLNLLQALDNRRPSDTGKWRNCLPLPLRAVAKVCLALTHIQQVLAALHERVHLCKDTDVVQDPCVWRELGIDPTQVLEGGLPGGTAGDALVEDSCAALHKAVKDVVERDLGFTALYDLPAHLE